MTDEQNVETPAAEPSEPTAPTTEVSELAKSIAGELGKEFRKETPGYEFASEEEPSKEEPAEVKTAEETLAENLKLREKLARITNKDDAERAKGKILDGVDNDAKKGFLSAVLDELPENSSKKAVYANARIYERAYDAAVDLVSQGVAAKIDEQIGKLSKEQIAAWGNVPALAQTQQPQDDPAQSILAAARKMHGKKVLGV